MVINVVNNLNKYCRCSAIEAKPKVEKDIQWLKTKGWYMSMIMTNQIDDKIHERTYYNPWNE